MNDVQTTTQQVVKFSVTDAAIAELAQKYADPKVPEGPEEYSELKAGIKEVAKYRIATEKERKVQNAAALAHQRSVNSEGGRITDALKAIEDPMKACKAEVDDAETRKVAEAEEKEFKRLDEIRLRLQRIEQFGQVSINDTVEAVKKRLKLVEALDPNDRFDEFAKRAAEAKANAFESLTDAVKQLEERAAGEERQRIEQEEIDTRKAALDEQERKQKEEQDWLDKEKAKREADESSEKQERLQKLEDEKRQREKVEAAEAEAKRQKELAPDKEKLLAFALSLRNCLKPVCKSIEAQNIVNGAVSRLDDLAEYIERNAGEL